MIEGLGPYPEVKESGVRGVGPVPRHWQVLRAKHLFREVDEKSVTGSEELLSVSHKTGVTPRSQKNVTMFRAESNVGYKRCRPGDIAINTMWAWMAALGVVGEPGIISPAYGVYRPVAPDRFLRRYLDELLRTPGYQREYVVRSTGITSSRLRLYPDQFLQIPMLAPAAEEQALIVRFLDHADRRIRRLIAAKQRMIKLVEEQKRAITRRAVLHGLDPLAATGNSGLGWAGHVPRHWRIQRLKNIMHNLNPIRVPLSSVERGRMTVRAYDYYGASGVIDRVDEYLFDDNLLLIAEDGANLVNRNLPLAIIARGKFWVNNHAHILKPRRGSLEYYASLLECLDYNPWITGAAQPKLTQDRLMAIAVPVPPEQEQVAIVAHIAAETRESAAVGEQARRELTLLREYRTRLVSDVVTGKLDVRAAAAALPAEAEPAEPLDDGDEAEDEADEPGEEAAE